MPTQTLERLTPHATRRMQQRAISHAALDAVLRWGAQQVKDPEERERELQLQLDELRAQKQAIQAQTLEALGQVLKAGQLAA
jgi:hypothetical protein